MTFTLHFSRAFSHTEVRGKVRYSKVTKDEAERVAKSPDQLQMELANGQGNGAA